MDKEGGSPLFHAILQRKQAVAELLLKYNADPNLAEASLDGYRGVSPLMTAVRHPGTYTDSHGVLRQVSLDGYRGVSPLMTAVRHPGTYTDSHGVLRQVSL